MGTDEPERADVVLEARESIREAELASRIQDLNAGTERSRNSKKRLKLRS